MKKINWSSERIIKLKKNQLVRKLLMADDEAFRIGLEGVLNHKLRSFLTMLGIIFGVAAVISMLAIGEGARRQTMARIQSLGLQNIIIKEVKPKDDPKNEQETNELTFDDVDALDKILEGTRAVVPVIERDLEVAYKNRRSEIILTGTQSKYFNLLSLGLKRGGYFSELDNNRYQRVCVVGSEAARSLFQVEEALGKMIKIGEVWFRVVGVLNYHPVSTAGTEQVDLNNHIFAPINSVNIRFDRERGESELEQIIVQLKKEVPVLQSARVIDQILMRRHNQLRNYTLIVPEQLLRQSEETQRIFNIVMGAIAGISLLVGGIGIMNIMLASVLERTKEVGIRRSLGATQKNILGQFLIEAMLLSLFGGITGILLGYGLALGITFFSDWETAISLWSVILAFGVSSGVGIIFGYYPAKKAAELNPIDALRYE